VEFAGPYSAAVDLTTGPDGNLWVLNQGEGNDSSLVVVGADQSVKATYTIPTSGASAAALTVGPDGNLWFVEQGTSQIGKVTPGGVFTEYPIPTTSIDEGFGPVDVAANPTALVAGPDGAIWFTESSTGKIGRITTDGTITEISTPGLQPQSIAVGADHNVWFTDSQSASTVDRINADGTISTFNIPTQFAYPTSLTLGPDGALWFAESSGHALGRVTTSGTVTEIPVAADISPQHLTFDATGNLWVTGANAGLVRITPSGVTTPLGSSLPSSSSPAAVTVGPDGAIWFTDPGTDQLGRMDPSSVNPAPTDHTLTIASSINAPGFAPNTLSFSGDLATFYDSNPTGVPGDFAATVDWGDGQTQPGAIRETSPGIFVVSSSHTYAQAGTYTLAFSISDTNPAHMPQPNSVTTSISVYVSDVVEFPPVLSVTSGGAAPVPVVVAHKPSSTTGGSSTTRFPDIRTIVLQFEANLLRATLARKHGHVARQPTLSLPGSTTHKSPVLLHHPRGHLPRHVVGSPLATFGRFVTRH
jgi:virginiamycin B lyase